MKQSSMLLKKIIAITLCAVLTGGTAVFLPEMDSSLLFTANAAEKNNGTTGDCYWTVNNDILTISGKGAMEDYQWNCGPWRDQIKEIIIENGVTRIGNYAFSGCLYVQKISISSTVTAIGDYAFRAVQADSISIPKSVKSIGKYSLTGNRKLTDLTLQSGLLTIGEGAFQNCENLKKVHISGSVNSIENYAFELCTKLSDIELENGIKNIGRSVFRYCAAEKIFLPDSIEFIDQQAFAECPNLKTVSLSNKMKSISYWLFDGCPELSEMVLPDSIETIDSGAFRNCTGLTDIFIPDSVTTIGDYAFYGCEDLTIHGSKGSYAETYAKKNSNNFALMPLSNKSTVTTTATVGEPIILNAVADGGTGDYTYALMYKKSTSSTWTKIGKKYGTQSTGSFTPKSAVKYDIMINVKDSSGTVKSKTFTVNVKAPLKNKTTINAETVKVGEKIVLKGAASGGTKGYQYAFYYKKSKNSNWIEMKPAYTTKSAAFKPGSAVSYDVKVVVRDSEYRTSEKVFKVKVTK